MLLTYSVGMESSASRQAVTAQQKESVWFPIQEDRLRLFTEFFQKASVFSLSRIAGRRPLRSVGSQHGGVPCHVLFQLAHLLERGQNTFNTSPITPSNLGHRKHTQPLTMGSCCRLPTSRTAIPWRPWRYFLGGASAATSRKSFESFFRWPFLQHNQTSESNCRTRPYNHTFVADSALKNL
jgi:hypothetical protein